LKPEWWGAPLVQKRRSTRGKGPVIRGDDECNDDMDAIIKQFEMA
jgi:hypothetical protein